MSNRTGKPGYFNTEVTLFFLSVSSRKILYLGSIPGEMGTDSLDQGGTYRYVKKSFYLKTLLLTFLFFHTVVKRILLYS